MACTTNGMQCGEVSLGSSCTCTSGSTGGSDGGWNGDEPGNGSNLRADSVAGGIRLRWAFPTVNPHAVAHVLLYRSVSTDFNMASLRTVLNGNEFMDWISLEQSQVYQYWIRFISLSGERLELIGPVAGTHDPALLGEVEDTQEPVSLANLSSDLQAMLARIEPLETALANEVLTLEEADDALALALADVNQTVMDRLSAMQAQVDTVTNIHTEYEQIANNVQAELNKRLRSVALTQDEYDALPTYDPEILYVILDI